MWYHRCRWLVVVALAGLAGCTKPTPGGPPGAAETPGGQAGAIRFWHTQTQENETALVQIVAEFNAAHPGGPPVEATYIGDYNQLFEKLRAFAADQTHSSLPDLSVAYESQIAEYMKADVVRPLDDLLADPATGLSPEQIADIYEPYLETNRFQQFGGKLLSFPFTKSNLMLFYNQSMLKEVGLDPPGTWDEFLDACRKIKAKRHITPYSCAVDPSTVDGMIFSMGGKLLDDGGRPQFDQPAATQTLQLIDTLFKAQKPGEELGYQVVDKGDQNNDFANEKCAFFFRSSTARPSIQKLVGRKFEWNMCGLPSAPGAEPVTVMFGGNICIFKSSPEREKTAWEFIKFFASTPITARWANVSGYLPVTRSAAKEQAMVDFFAAAPQNRAAFDLLTVARPEPNVAGWQAVRKCLEDAETALVTQLRTPAEVGVELQQCAATALAPKSPQ